MTRETVAPAFKTVASGLKPKLLEYSPRELDSDVDFVCAPLRQTNR